MNLEQIILLLVSGQGILLSLALLSSIFRKRLAVFFLGLITFIFTIEILNIWAMRMSYHSSDNAFPFWLLGSYLIIPPALLFFVRANTQPDFRFKRKSLLLFLPALIEIAVELFSFYSNKVLHTGYNLIDNTFWYILTEIVPVFAMIFVLVLFGKKLYSLYLQVKQMPSKGNGYSQIHRLTVFFVIFSILTLFWLLITLFDFQVFTIIEVILLLFLFAIGYIGYFKPSFFDIPRVLKTQLVADKYPQFNDKSELEKLTALFEDEKVYTKQKLSLKEVATHLGLPERYVSELINSYFNVSFTSYVNSFRVKEAMQRINDPREKNKTLLAIAMEAGFNSKSSFNKIFKDTTGKNPSYYLNK
ncbi:helix-turn-helix domain-containing protein [Winogradskyella ursingii]|uniref:helix-turn-helix domain-containing protein n=1 Tax=Winogradskyella ursingii TaxID=2686079 RepID=UPI0015CAEA2B|nr:helix-turn-helix transcriptional regulator [Winogradskyella ursingii]